MSTTEFVLATLAALAGLGCLGLAWALGRTRRALRSARQARAAAVELQERTADLAVAAERIRIVREMHDVIAHSLAIMIAQADGGSFVTADAEASRRVFLTIAETGRGALSDTRRILGVLRHGDEAPALAPVAESLAELVSQAGAAGLLVELVEVGEPRPLPSANRLALYRICQEALTNVLKHAGAGARVVVTQNWREAEVVLTVTDHDGEGASLPGELGDLGLGLLGMHERAESVGGTMDSGPVPDGYQVRAIIPVTAAPEETDD